MHCIYLTNWHQDFILVYFILKVSFTFLKIKPASYDKIKRRNPQAVLDPAMDEQPILFYTEQFNFLKSEDRKTIFKALLTMRMMDIKSWDYWRWGTNMIEMFKSQKSRLNANQVLQKNNSCSRLQSGGCTYYIIYEITDIKASTWLNHYFKSQRSRQQQGSSPNEWLHTDTYIHVFEY